MKFNCPKCASRYVISDERVRGKVLKIKCKKCGNVMVVREKRKPDTAFPAAPAQAQKPSSKIEKKNGLAGEQVLPARPRQAENKAESPHKRPGAGFAGEMESRGARSGKSLQFGGEARFDISPPVDSQLKKVEEPEAITSSKPSTTAAPLRSKVSHEKPLKTTPSADSRANPAVVRRRIEIKPSDLLPVQKKAHAPEELENKAEARTAARPAAHNWYLASGGKSSGPYTADEIQEEISSGRATPRTHLWRHGYTGWKRLSESEEFKKFLQVPPSPPPFELLKHGPEAAVSQAKSAEAPAEKVKLERTIEEAAPQPEGANVISIEEIRASAALKAFEALAAASQVPVAEEGPAVQPEFAEKAGPPAEAEEPVTEESAKSLAAPPAPAFAEPAQEEGADSVYEAVEEEGPGEYTRYVMVEAGVDKKVRIAKQSLVVAGGLATLGAVIWVSFVLGWFQRGTAIEKEFQDGMGTQPAAGQQEEIQVPKNDPLRNFLLGSAPKSPQAPAASERQARPRSRPRETDSKSDTGGMDFKNQSRGFESQTATGGNRMAGSGHGPGVSPEISLSMSNGMEGAREPELRMAGGTLDLSKAMKPENLPDSLSEERIMKVVRDNQPSVKYCLEKALKRDYSASGKLTVRITIRGSSGEVKDVEVLPAKLARSVLGECLSQRLRLWRFPLFKGEQTVEVPFHLTGSY